MSELRNRLLAKNRKVAFSITVEGEQVDVIKPTVGDRARILAAARAAGELGAENESTNDPLKQAELSARLAAAILFDPATGRPAFSIDDVAGLLDTPWLEEHIPAIMRAFTGKSVEEEKGN